MNVVKRYSWILIVVFFGIIIFSSRESPQETNIIQEVDEEVHQESSPDETSETMVVDVKGAVGQPGVYSVKSGKRVDDVIEMAGGLTERADLSSVNLAQKLQDEMVIHVAELVSNEGEERQSLGKNEGKVRINQASASDIESLNGIGPSKAAAIIQHRDENGPFSSIEGLLEVPGIGKKTLENMKEEILLP